MKFLAIFVVAMFLGVAMADSKEKKHPKHGGAVKPRPKPTLKPEPECGTEPATEAPEEPDCGTEPATEAPQEPESACNIMCTMEYRPQCCLPVSRCGDSKIFGNPCAVGVYNCQNPNEQYYVYAQQECDSIGKDYEYPIEILA